MVSPEQSHPVQFPLHGAFVGQILRVGVLRTRGLDDAIWGYWTVVDAVGNIVINPVCALIPIERTILIITIVFVMKRPRAIHCLIQVSCIRVRRPRETLIVGEGRVAGIVQVHVRST